jgi:hypothetical protein
MNKRFVFFSLLLVTIAVMTFIMANGKLIANDDSTIGLNAKIDKIISNQEQIISKLDNITAELKIVKIRATR